MKSLGNIFSRKVGLILAITFTSVCYLLCSYYHKNFLSPWYYGALKQKYVPKIGFVDSCRAIVIPKSKNNATTLFYGKCECSYVTAKGITIRTNFETDNDSISELVNLQNWLNRNYLNGKEITVLVHPYYEDDIIVSYKEASVKHWMGVTLGLIIFLFVFIPCFLVLAVSITSLIRPNSPKI